MVTMRLRSGQNTPNRSKYYERCTCGARKYVWVSGNYPGRDSRGVSNFHLAMNLWWSKHLKCGAR